VNDSNDPNGPNDPNDPNDPNGPNDLDILRQRPYTSPALQALQLRDRLPSTAAGALSAGNS